MPGLRLDAYVVATLAALASRKVEVREKAGPPKVAASDHAHELRSLMHQ
jgi:hypothetical protein